MNYYCSNSFSLDRVLYKNIKKGVLQFVLLKPITAVLSIILNINDLYREGDFSISSSYLYVSLVNNISISVSLYCLALFYMGFESELQPFRPLSKFLCIKFVLFFSYWQGFAFELFLQMSFIESVNAKIYQSLLMCFEMMVASVALGFAFSHWDFVDYSRDNNQFINNLKSVIDVSDLIEDAESVFTKDLEDTPLKDMRVGGEL
mmetsp:Transcript_17547/g.18194  ORF Transcript_17547/g.18194 Transcript_17547/m.18194 type:complete len:204 (-) Transcript_17547:62-673(-)